MKFFTVRTGHSGQGFDIPQYSRFLETHAQELFP
ncbi:protein of unknown function (plasmid) [Azospirillum baldaniorum]|uniref:Uncharacterized protein n=1 Tax=Azospirillum baldaniorum TaxID=1064539 RepID=A0A9P1JUQ6_9PROT|nr:protein of unknown function [Azospirillum baldaniorum]